MKEIVRRRHELAAHCYGTEDRCTLTMDEEREVVDKSLFTRKRISEVCPVGWLSHMANMSASTLKQVLERKN